METNNKISAEHLKRKAYLYIRQSTIQQVINNSESTRRQYELKVQAVVLGWPRERIEVIDSDSNGYSITPLGAKILKKLVSIEQILNDENRTIMIRTSKYSKEPFNINKIEEYLVREGEMETFLAKKIAEEVKERLAKTTIDYLNDDFLLINFQVFQNLKFLHAFR